MKRVDNRVLPSAGYLGAVACPSSGNRRSETVLQKSKIPVLDVPVRYTVKIPAVMDCQPSILPFPLLITGISACTFALFLNSFIVGNPSCLLYQ